MFLNKNLPFFLVSSIILSCIVGNRGGTNDTAIYVYIFNNITDFNLLSPSDFYSDSGVEIGYGWYSYFIRFFTQNYFILLSIFSFLTFFVIYKICIKLKVSFLWVLLLYVSSAYFLMQQFMQMRQGIAIPIALFAIVSLINSRKKITLYFVILSLLAFSLHQTSLLVISVGYFSYIFLKCSYISLSKFRFWLIFVLITGIVISKFFLVDVFLSISDRVVAYSNSSYGESIDLFRLPNVKAILILLFLIFFMNSNMNQNLVFQVFMCLLSIGVAFRIGFSDFAILSGRLSTAFSHVEIFLLPFVFLRFGYVYGRLLLVFYIILQAISVYIFQAPYVLESYGSPLEL